MPLTSISTKHEHYQHPSESLTRAIDFTPVLRPGETISSATVAISPSSGPTLGSATVATEELTNEDGGVAAVGNAVQFSLSTLVVGTDYVVTVTATTNLGNVRVVTLTIYCRAT